MLVLLWGVCTPAAGSTGQGPPDGLRQAQRRCSCGKKNKKIISEIITVIIIIGIIML